MELLATPFGWTTMVAHAFHVIGLDQLCWYNYVRIIGTNLLAFVADTVAIHPAVRNTLHITDYRTSNAVAIHPAVRM